MGSYYLVKKHIKKNYYWYYQTTWREGSNVRCHCIYVGPVNKIARPPACRGLASKPKASMNAGMHNQYPGDPAAEGRAAVMRDDFNRKAAAELATLSGFHEDRWFEYASVHGVNLNEYLERAITFKGKERNAYLNKLVDVVTGYSTDTFPPLASTAYAKTSMNGGMNQRDLFLSVTRTRYEKEIARLEKEIKEMESRPLLPWEQTKLDKMRTSLTEKKQWLQSDKNDFTAAQEREMKKKTLRPGIGGPLDLHENHTFSNVCPACMNEDTVELTERELRQMNIGNIDKNIAEKGYYEQPLEQKQEFCKKTGGHRDFIIGEQKEIDGQLRTEYKCGWCGTIQYR